MIGTYAAVLAVCAASPAIGQAAIALCGMRRWSWLSPAVGLAMLGAICWATVRLPGHGVLSAILVAALTVTALIFLRGRAEGAVSALRIGAPVALLALAAASLPFLAESHFGILGTSFNPDMSQHLLATERLAQGQGSQLLHQGYPLGPHSIVVALNKGLGIGLVQGFSGLMVAIAILAPLTALAAFAELSPLRRTAAALIVGLPYMVASYYAQGAFKEILQALFLLAFVLALREASGNPKWRERPLRFVPAALIAVGSAYAYSFPGLTWLVGTAVLWLLADLALARSGRSARGPAPARALGLASLLFVVLIAPEIGRMINFHSFETFNPNGPGLGNLFGQISPFEALGSWPSGDFRLTPGAGAVPAAGYYLGAAFALGLLLYGVARISRRRETAILSGLAASVLAYLAARVAGTPYTASKAIEIAAPLVALTILLPLVATDDARRLSPGGQDQSDPNARLALLAAVYMAAAGVCSLLAFANAPVGPPSYSPALTGFRPLVASSSTLVLAPAGLLENDHGTPYIAWELRGGRVCIESEGGTSAALPSGVRFVITPAPARRPPFPGLRVLRATGPYVLWERVAPTAGKSECPLIAVRQARQGNRPQQ